MLGGIEPRLGVLANVAALYATAARNRSLFNLRFPPCRCEVTLIRSLPKPSGARGRKAFQFSLENLEMSFWEASPFLTSSYHTWAANRAATFRAFMIDPSMMSLAATGPCMTLVGYNWPLPVASGPPSLLFWECGYSTEARTLGGIRVVTRNQA